MKHWFNPLSDSPVRLVTRRETQRYMRPAVRDTACKHGYVVCGECQRKLARAVEEENATAAAPGPVAKSVNGVAWVKRFGVGVCHRCREATDPMWTAPELNNAEGSWLCFKCFDAEPSEPPQPETRVVGGVTWFNGHWYFCTPCLDREAEVEQPEDWRAKAREMGWGMLNPDISYWCRTCYCEGLGTTVVATWGGKHGRQGEYENCHLTRCDACMRAEVERASQPEPELPEGWEWTAQMDGTHAMRGDGAGSVLKNEKGWRGGIQYKISDYFPTARAAAEWVDAQLREGK